MKYRERLRRDRRVMEASELVDRVVDGYHLGDHLRRVELRLAWPDLVGRRIAQRAWPGALRDGVLNVRVANSSWHHELSFLRDDLVERINNGMGDPPLVRELRLVLGRRDASDVVLSELAASGDVPSGMRATHPRSGPRALPEPARGEHLESIRTETEAVEDPELRAIIADVRRRLDC